MVGLEEYQPAEELLAETVGAVVSILFVGLVQENVFPALSDMVIEQVDPFVVPVVQGPPDTFIPEPPESVEPDSVNDVPVAVLCQGPDDGDHDPQTGAVVS